MQLDMPKWQAITPDVIEAPMLLGVEYVWPVEITNGIHRKGKNFVRPNEVGVHRHRSWCMHRASKCSEYFVLWTLTGLRVHTVCGRRADVFVAQVILMWIHFPVAFNSRNAKVCGG